MSTTEDKGAFLKLIQQNKRIIYKICNSYCRNRHDREDLAQEIVYQLWRSGSSFNEDYKFSTWMYRIALNVAISFYRKGKTSNELLVFQDELIDTEDHDSTNPETEETIRLLQKFINEFHELDRALMLLYLEEKSYKEIAEIIGISESNVSTKVGRLKDKLKQRFASLKHE